VIKPEKATPETPAAEPPETPLGAGPGLGATGGLLATEPPWPPPAGGSGAAIEAAAAAKLPGAEESKGKLCSSTQPAAQLCAERRSSAESSQVRPPFSCAVLIVAAVPTDAELELEVAEVPPAPQPT